MCNNTVTAVTSQVWQHCYILQHKLDTVSSPSISTPHSILCPVHTHRVQGVHGNRKRSRTPSSSGSESRIAPRKPFGRTRAPERSSNNSRSTHNNDDTPPGAGSRPSPLGTHDEFLDDVRFDVAPKDMCIASSQNSARGGDDSVVLQQLCSLGSVLAGGKSDGTGAGDEQEGSSGSSGHHSADGGNGSRGTSSRDDAVGGGSLLTRWLQPTATAHGESCPRRASKTGRKGGGGLPGGGNNASVASGSGGGAGTRNVGDWAKKALLRKKLADAERGRRLRLQLEEGATLGGGPGERGTALSLAPPTPAAAEAAAAAAADQRAMEAVAASSAGSSPKESSSPPAAATNASQSDAAPASNSTTNEKPLPRSGSPAETPAQGTASAATPLILAPAAAATGDVDRSGAGTNGNIITVVDEEDEYGDDFDFLTDADLQALEEQATKTAAVCSQQAASASQQHVGQRGHNSAIGSSQPAPPYFNGTGPKPPESGASNAGSNAGAGTKVGGATTLNRNLSALNTAGSRRPPQAARSKRSPNGSAGRPPLSTIGPNSKRGGGHRQQSQGRATSAIAHHGGSAGSCGGGSSSQSGNRGPSQLSQRHQRRAAPGRGDGVWLQSKVLSGGGTAPASVASQQGAAPAASDPALFTTYTSMEAFTRSMKPSRPNAGQAPAAAGAVSDKGQARLTKWAHQQPSTGTRSMVPAVAAARQGAIPGKHPNVVTGPFEFNPALVHRRFLVLEVTYVSARSGNDTGVASREKVLMALEQGRKEATTVVDPDAVLPAKDGSDAGDGAGMAQQRKISLLEDWYDCEVEPGDVVHVLFPVASDGVGDGDGDGDGALPTGARKGFSDDAEEEIFMSPQVVVDNRSGRLLVVQPDILVSPTKVADTVQCTRKAVLQSRLTSDASKSKPAVLGNLKHELFETSLLAAAAAAAATKPTATTTSQPRAQRPSPVARAASTWQKQGAPGSGSGSGGGGGDLLTSQYMTKLVNRIVVSQLEALYGAGLDEDTARRELLNVSGPILQWHRSFLARTGAGGNGEGGTASFNSAGARDARITVSRVLATEDDVWSPVLGLKGIMDATVEASVQPVQAPVYGGGGGEGASSLVMPVEVKTGKRIGEANSSHRAQVCVRLASCVPRGVDKVMHHTPVLEAVETDAGFCSRVDTFPAIFTQQGRASVLYHVYAFPRPSTRKETNMMVKLAATRVWYCSECF